MPRTDVERESGLRLDAFDAVLFDMDGTLVASESIWFAVEREVAGALGVQIPDEASELMHGVQAAAIPALLASRFGLELDAAAYLDAVTRTVLQRLREAVDREGAGDLVRRVAAAEKTRAIVSNSSREVVAATLAERPWTAELPERFSVDDVTRGKPEPDLYLHAAATLGVAPTACLAIEDSVTGVTAAVAAGMTCVAVTFGLDPRPFEERTPFVVSTLAEVGELLD